MMLALALASLLGSPAAITVQADQALRGVPPELIGANFTSYSKDGSSTADWVPCCLAPAAGLPQPVALWRTPGGILGDYFHIDGLYDDTVADYGNAGNGVDMIHWLGVAAQLQGSLLHILNLNATDQELENEIEYLNSSAPADPDPGWTTTSYRFDALAPAGYFAWLRGAQGHPAPAGVRFVELGNEVWNYYNDHTRCSPASGGAGISTCYGPAAATLYQELKAIDPSLQIGVSVLTLGQSANPDYHATDIYAAFADAGLTPDFIFDHGYYNCGTGAQDATEATYSAQFGDYVQQAGATNRAQLTAAFGQSCGNQVGMFFDEFGPQACASNADAWESFGYWETAAAAHMYAAGLHAGYTNVSYYDWNDGSATGNDGLVYGEPGQVDANYWGLWFASKLVQGAASEVPLSGAPSALRAFAVESDAHLRVLLVNTDAANAQALSLSVSGRTPSASRAYVMDQSYATLASVPATRSGVPQTAPVAAAIDLTGFSVAPLSTTLVELDFASGSAPTAAAASSGQGCIPGNAADAGTIDAGTIDAGTIDSGTIDSGTIDAGTIDAGTIDAGTIDAGSIDSGSIDSGSIDSGSIDAGTADAGAQDAGARDGGAVDAGGASASPGGCGSGSAPSLELALLGVILALGRRRSKAVAGSPDPGHGAASSDAIALSSASPSGRSRAVGP